MDLDSLRSLCMKMPGAEEGLKWEDHICFMIAEKIFCMTGPDGHTCFKVTPEQFDELIECDGIKPTPYIGRNKWVTVEHFNGMKQKEWMFYISQSYDIIFSKLPKNVQNKILAQKK